MGCRNARTVMFRLPASSCLTCHYCGYTYPVPTECPNCGSTELMGRGIEQSAVEIFPEARIARNGLGHNRTRNAYEPTLISNFSLGKTNLLIGTQMKDLDFDKVSVVGILNADSMLDS